MQFQEYTHIPEETRLSFLARLQSADWRGAHFLYELLHRDTLAEYSGADPRLLLLTERDCFVSFCVLCARDEIHGSPLSPWIEFVYTFPEYRGHCYSQLIIDHACSLAIEQGHFRIYIASDECGLYEKYGFRFLDHMRNVRGEMTQVFFRDL